MKKRIYLDYNASAPLRPESLEAMRSVLSIHGAALNASSIHSFGREGRKIIDTARSKIASFTGAEPNQVTFNSGATEGNNTIIQYFCRKNPQRPIIVSSIEHSSILEAAPNLLHIDALPNGSIDIEALEHMLENNKDTQLVSVMMVNNETGAIQNVSQISKIAHKYGALFHCDAVQAAGRLPIDIKTLGIDFLTISSHKIGGPQGAGALITGFCGEMPSLIYGGGQERGARSGTENVAAIAGFGAAAETSMLHMNEYSKKMEEYRSKLEETLLSCCPDIIIHARESKRVANTVFFSLPGIASDTLVMALDIEGVAVSGGSACSSGSTKPSHVLKSMMKENSKYDSEILNSALRISMGWATQNSDIDYFLELWEKIYKRIKKSS